MNNKRLEELKFAGQSKKCSKQKVTDCLQINKPETPEKLKRFRKTSLLQVGQQTLNSRNY